MAYGGIQTPEVILNHGSFKVQVSNWQLAMSLLRAQKAQRFEDTIARPPK